MALSNYILDETKKNFNSINNNAIDILNTLGRSALHSVSPDNFEYYMCSMELLDSNKNTKAYMIFSVMPNNMMETKTQIASVTKTNSGVVTTFNSSFVPRDISVQGTFGRKLRLVLGMKEFKNNNAITNLINSGNLGFTTLGNDTLVKTGFGLTKMLKKIIDTAYTLDDNGNPYILIWNNYAFNTSYVVEILQDSFSQSFENNMLWYYSLEMKAIAPASAIKIETAKGFTNKVFATSIANGINKLLLDVTKINNF